MQLGGKTSRKLKAFESGVDDLAGWEVRRQMRLDTMPTFDYKNKKLSDPFEWREIVDYSDTQLYTKEMSQTLLTTSQEQLFLWELFYQSKKPVTKPPQKLMWVRPTDEKDDLLLERDEMLPEIVYRFSVLN